MSSAWQYISASRFDAPMTLVGFTALSVEISTIACAPAARAASATWRVPAALVSRPSSGLASHHRHMLQRGGVEHQFRAAAPRTPRGCAPRRAHRRSRARRGTPGWLSAEFEVDLPQRVFAVVEQHQQLRARARRPGAPVREPIVPPAPVTSTRRPCTSRAMPSRSSGTCGRFSRSSIATGLQFDGRARRPRWSSAVGRGARAARSPWRSAVSISAASAVPVRSGSVTTSERRQPVLRRAAGPAPRRRRRSSRGSGSPWMRRPVCARPSESRPATR